MDKINKLWTVKLLPRLSAQLNRILTLMVAIVRLVLLSTSHQPRPRQVDDREDCLTICFRMIETMKRVAAAFTS